MMSITTLILPALLLCLLLALLAAPLGALMTWRNYTFFSESFAHGALLGCVLAMLWGLPLWLGSSLAAFILLVVINLIKHPALPQASVLLSLSALMLSGAAVIMVKYPMYSYNLEGLLFGDVLLVSKQEVWIGAGVVSICLGILYAHWPKLLKWATSEILAVAEGISIVQQRMILTTLLALFCMFAVQAIGAVLTTSFLVLPALTARCISNSPRQFIGVSWACLLLSVVIGFLCSIEWGWPTGASIVLCLGALFLLSFGLRRKRI